ncbi:hypothetical protein KKC06_06635 [Patescibacteria group bacterium]|nr:hypothetical protein [Patescibacteria group bacterium]
MDYHGIFMVGDFETDNIKAKDANGVKIYSDSGTIGFTVDDNAYIKAYQGASINEFSIDGTLAGNSDLALSTEKAVKTYVDTKVTALALGTMSIQNANAVAITGGSVVGITDITVVDGGTGASSAADARTNLGLTGDSNTTHYHDSRYYTESELTNGATDLILGRLKIDNSTKADGYLYDSTLDPTNTTRLNYDGYFYATRVYNAVYNDVADFQDLNDEMVFGKCYFDTNLGAEICNQRCQMGIMGIATDTFGLSCGTDSRKKQVPISISGWVLAYVDKIYPIGTPLTNDENGNLTIITLEEKGYYPERLIATYKKPEKEIMWNGVVVNNRHWVKVKG